MSESIMDEPINLDILLYMLLDGQLGFGFDERRGKLRYAWGSCMQALIPRFLNVSRDINTPGIETSQYRQEEKIIIIPLLAESEKGTGQTESALEKELEMWWRSLPKSMI